MAPDDEADHPALAAAARNCGEGYALPSRRMGRPSLTSDRVIAADLGLPVPVPPNSATLLRPMSALGVAELLPDLRMLFSGPGGGWQIFDPWGQADLAGDGFHRGSVPCMLRPAGGSVPPPPAGLTVVEVVDEATVDDMNTVITDGYGLPSNCAPYMYTVDAFGDPRYRAWVGYVDGVPVSTAAGCVAGGLVGVYVVATLPEARGHGYGEALTWAAVASAPHLDATLQASDMGRPIYERMGFQTIRMFATWATDRVST